MVQSLGSWHVSIDSMSAEVAWARQVHGAFIVPVADIDEGTKADGIFVSQPGVKVGVWTADCMPLVMVGKNSALVLHVSRKSLVAGLLEQVPKFLNLSEIKRVFIGPHICAKHFMFEWEGEGIAAFKQKFSEAVETREKIIHLSLRRAVQQYFDEWTVTSENIVEDTRCTYETLELPSHKRWLLADKPGALQNFMTSIWRD